MNLLRRVGPTLLGGFVLFQLTYMLVANLVLCCLRTPLPDRREIVLGTVEGRTSRIASVQSAIEAVDDVCRAYAVASGQQQGWRMFSPRYAECAVFPLFEFTGPDGRTEAVRSPFEPTDPDHYARWVMNDHRIFLRESWWGVLFNFATPESLSRDAAEWRTEIARWTWTFERSLSAYLRFRYGDRVHASTAVTVKFRCFPRPPFGGGPRPAVFEIPLARWTPEDDAWRPYDPVTGDFGEPHRP